MKRLPRHNLSPPTVSEFYRQIRNQPGQEVFSDLRILFDTKINILCIGDRCHPGIPFDSALSLLKHICLKSECGRFLRAGEFLSLKFPQSMAISRSSVQFLPFSRMFRFFRSVFQPIPFFLSAPAVASVLGVPNRRLPWLNFQPSFTSLCRWPGRGRRMAHGDSDEWRGVAGGREARQGRVMPRAERRDLKGRRSAQEGPQEFARWLELLQRSAPEPVPESDPCMRPARSQPFPFGR
jgi:hypothetical protein